jgi:hypothetical protein
MIMNRFVLLGLAILFWQLGAYGAEPTFSEILRYPARYDGKKVTLTGLAEDTGNGVHLFRNFTAAKDRDIAQAIFVRYSTTVSQSDLARWWISVTGTLSAKDKGRSGENACSIEANKITQLHIEPKSLWPANYGIFHNNTEKKIAVASEDETGGEIGVHLSPGEKAPLKIIEGGKVTVEDWSVSGFPKPVLFSTKIHVSGRRATDPSVRNFEFVITGNGILRTRR